jgi:NAD(P)-dependent dehydrogenase (short-subunit alcohol dehydrogenase family)
MAKTWFITGISSGLGRSMTEKLLARGDRVVGTVRKPDTVNDLKKRYGDRLTVATLDLTDTAAIRSVIDTAFGAMGRMDVIVSNAGYGLFGAGEEVTDEQIRHQIETNLIGSIQLIRAALPRLRAQGGGRILQVSSEGGQVAYPNFSLYHATKWGIEGFVESVAQEVRPFNIELTLIEPGATATDFGKGLVSPPPLAAYENTPAGEIRRMIQSGKFPLKGDANKTAQAIIDCAERNPAPKRLTLGSDAYQRVRAALTERLATLDAQKAIADSTDMAPSAS